MLGLGNDHLYGLLQLGVLHMNGTRTVNFMLFRKASVTHSDVSPDVEAYSQVHAQPGKAPALTTKSCCLKVQLTKEK